MYARHAGRGRTARMSVFETHPGSAHPLGVDVRSDGVNFSLFSEDATGVLLLLFDSAIAVEPFQTIRFDPFHNKTFHFWHVFVRGCGPGTYYAFRIDGELDPARGFVAETVSASVLYFMAMGMHAPVSTTHTITSAIMGVGATRRLSAVRWGVAKNIVVAWVLTIPAAGAVAALLFVILRPILT